MKNYMSITFVSVTYRTFLTKYFVESFLKIMKDMMEGEKWKKAMDNKSKALE